MTRVIKVGGSLLDWPELPARLWQWLAMQSRASNVLIAGGGELAEAIRRYDAIQGLGQELSHRLCLQAMRSSAAILEQIVRHARMTQDERALDHHRSLNVIDVNDYLETPLAEGRAHLTLPHTWAVTSDSIAAHIAETLCANELVLLKSASLPRSCATEVAAEQQYVDAFFPQAAAKASKIRVVNLRDEHFAEWILYHG